MYDGYNYETGRYDGGYACSMCLRRFPNYSDVSDGMCASCYLEHPQQATVLKSQREEEQK